MKSDLLDVYWTKCQ